jgi:hypothetical protein
MKIRELIEQLNLAPDKELEVLYNDSDGRTKQVTVAQMEVQESKMIIEFFGMGPVMDQRAMYFGVGDNVTVNVYANGVTTRPLLVGCVELIRAEGNKLKLSFRGNEEVIAKLNPKYEPNGDIKSALDIALEKASRYVPPPPEVPSANRLIEMDI